MKKKLSSKHFHPHKGPKGTTSAMQEKNTEKNFLEKMKKILS